MGRGKKRNTAKTGDKALYKAREELEALSAQKRKNVDDDDMYNEVDRYNNARDELQDDMLKFGQTVDSDEEAGVQNDVENVFDLGIDQSDDDDDDSDSDDSSSEDDDEAGKDVGSSSDDADDDSSMDDGMDQLDEPDILNWGKRKKDYYHGDTADLEIGQEVEDAELEEEAGKEVLKARLEGMTEDDFMLDDDDDSDDEGDDDSDQEENKSGTAAGVQIMTDNLHANKRRKLSALSKRDKIKLMTKTHPELMPLITHFRDEAIQPCADETLVATNALVQSDENAEAVGATLNGIKYLLTKSMIQTATALNVCQYLLIKADQASKSNDKDANDDDNTLDDQDDEDIKNHPVISRLNQLNHLSEKLNDGVEMKVHGLQGQMENLVKASALMANGDDDDDEEEEDVNEAQTSEGGEEVSMDDQDMNMEENGSSPFDKNDNGGDSDSDTSSTTTASSSDDEEEEGVRERRILNEARFALRQQDDNEDQIMDNSSKANNSKRRRRRAVPTITDIGDEDADEAEVAAAGKKLASTINKITQKSKSGKKISAAPEVNDDDDDARLMRGLAMMENDLGDDGDDIGGGDDDGDDFDDDLDDEGDDFYSQIKKKSKAKKEYKKSLYAVAPKYPGLDNEIEGERAIGQMIMKNRGLVAHKNKLNRNPRVKKREQYRKALIRRRGAVREVRTEEGHKYGGEGTGIRSGLSRSRKLGVR